MKSLSALFAVPLFVALTQGCATREVVDVSAKPGDYVVLLHGLGRTSVSMRKLERHIARRGYRVINVSYPSTRNSIEVLAGKYLKETVQRKCADPERRIHFVTHSLGGIVVRCYLRDKHPRNLGRVVMLSPPNQGSELADHFGDGILSKAFIGPAGRQLGVSPDSVPNTLGPVDFELGIITGDRTFNPYFSKIIPGPDDGNVSVERAKVEGMADFLVVHHTHTFIMRSGEVIRQILYFLENGKFRREGDLK